MQLKSIVFSGNKIIFKLLLITCFAIISKVSQAQSFVVFRLDDMHFYENKMAFDIIKVFEKNNIPLNLSFIPFYQNKDSLAVPLGEDKIESLRKLIQSKQIDIQLHGFQHQKNGLGEFSNIPLQRQEKWLTQGKSKLDSIFKYNVHVFTPPWNEYDKNTLTALSNTGFKGISANIFGESSHDKLQYLPATTENWMDAADIIDQGKKHNAAVVFLMHPYQFKNEAEIQKLEQILKKVKTMNIPILLFSEAFKKHKLTADRLQGHQNVALRYLRKINIHLLNSRIYYPEKYLKSLRWAQTTGIVIGAFVLLFVLYLIMNKLFTRNK